MVSGRAMDYFIGKFLEATSYTLIHSSRFGSIRRANTSLSIGFASTTIVRTSQLLLDEAAEICRIASILGGVLGGPHGRRHSSPVMLML